MKNFTNGKKRIVVLEDEPAIIDVCKRVLNEEGFEVDIATSGEVALDMIEKNQYDLCLIDTRKPEMNGEELYLWMEDRHPELADHVVFATGVAKGENNSHVLTRESQLYLSKPFSPEDLKAIVRHTFDP
ncbi:response regulator [Chloroflexota bacterium]